MTVATIQFQTVEDWVGANNNLPNMIDGDDATGGAVVDSSPGFTKSVRMYNPVVPSDFGSLNTLTMRAVRSSQSTVGRGLPNVHRIYSREADATAWVQRWDGNIDAGAKTTNTFAVPVTTLANLQILVENFAQPAGGGSPPDPTT